MNENILISTPIDNVASLVTTQDNCTNTVEMDYEQQVASLDAIKTLLKSVKLQVGITSKSQWKNLRHSRNKGKNGKYSSPKYDYVLTLADSYQKLKLRFDGYNIMRRQYADSNSTNRKTVPQFNPAAQTP